MSEQSKQPSDAPRTSRRNFLKSSSLLMAGGAMVGGNLSIAQAAHAYGSDEIKIGLVGCGGRGTGAAVQAMNTEGPVKLIAMGDVFGDRLQGAYRAVKGQHSDKVDVPQDRQHVGFDCYQKVLAEDIDLVILATPPGFRPLHFEAAVEAGKDVFMEKPVAVDAPGVRRVLEANKKAKEKGLAVAVGLQRHHEDRYRETIKRLQDGAIGDIILGRCYWNSGGVWVRPRNEKQTELEYQMRNWYYFNWLCGDHIVEQHIHNIDVINWLMDDYPSEGQGQGGREVRKYIPGFPETKEYGQIFDHHMVEFTYPNGTKMLSQCRHIKGCWSSVSEYAHGTKGHADISGAKIFDAKGESVWSYGRGGGGGHQQEHHDLFALLRKGEKPNEGDYGAKSTMTAIYGRMCTYSGQKISWDDAFNSDISLCNVDDLTSFEDTAPVLPDEDKLYPVPVPGQTRTV